MIRHVRSSIARKKPRWHDRQTNMIMLYEGCSYETRVIDFLRSIILNFQRSMSGHMLREAHILGIAVDGLHGNVFAVLELQHEDLSSVVIAPDDPWSIWPFAKARLHELVLDDDQLDVEYVYNNLVEFHGYIGYCVWQRPFPVFGFHDGSGKFSCCWPRRTQGTFERYIRGELFFKVVNWISGLYGGGSPPLGFYIQGNVYIMTWMLGVLLNFMVVVSRIGLKLCPCVESERLMGNW